MPKLLIVDDNAAGRETLAVVFQSMGYDAVVAPDGLAGVEAARTELPDLILMDLNLPRMNGGEDARRLRADSITARVPVIAMTARVSPGEA